MAKRKPKEVVLLETDDMRVTTPRFEHGQRSLPFIGADEVNVEVAQCSEDYGDDKKDVCHIYRFNPERLKVVTDDDGEKHMVHKGYKPDAPHHPRAYRQWFDKDLKEVASSMSMSEAELRAEFTSEDPKRRAMAYADVGNYFGFDNLDGYPLVMSRAKFEKRWK